MSAKAERQGGEVVGVDVGECEARRAARGEEGFEAGLVSVFHSRARPSRGPEKATPEIDHVDT